MPYLTGHASLSALLTLLLILHTYTALIITGAEGFRVDMTRGDEHGVQRPNDKDLAGKLFYYDGVHPDGLTGHKFMGELASQVCMCVYTSYCIHVTGQSIMSREWR